jgi:DUF971 family protein
MSAVDPPLPRALETSDPKSVRVDVTGGAGMAIAWKDGHQSQYSFAWLRDACPCAMCNEEREKAGREPGESPKTAPGALPMFKAAAKPNCVEPTGKYAIRFYWNDSHDLGIYSWTFLREHCPCAECRATKA